MSEQKLVSPLLDGFQMGAPISSHDGVRCCPAIRENSDQKYIVKILSIPASQSQLEALLLTGAFQDAAGALNYFRELADGVVREAQLHQQLARLDGFVPCEAWQVVPMDDNQLGYDVYLLTPYRRTLERYLKKNTMTHLEAVNLGLDICAALAASRRAGHIYVDLKPSNIFISDDRRYLIGDLGFISMDSMKYAALPSKYRSSYTAPEMQDVFATISDTADIYALGLILYQVYNDGQLPGDELAAPANADYEMAEIILKACHADPAQRWQDPTVMGQALVAYMQRNTINDVPIMPPVIPVAVEEPPVEEAPAEETAADEVAVEEAAVTEEAPVEAEVEEAAGEAEIAAEPEDAADEAESAAEPVETVEEVPEAADIAAVTEESSEVAETPEDAAEITEEAETAAEEAVQTEEAAMAEPVETPAAEEVTEDASAAANEEDIADDPEDSVAAELAAVYNMISEDATPEEEVRITETDAVSDDITEILAHAEELVAHEIPEPVMVPEPKLPVEEPAPEPEPEEPEQVPAAEETADDDDDDDDDGEDEIDIPIAIPDLEPVKKKGKKWLAIIAIIALLAGMAYGAYYYYQNYYLVPVESIVLEGGTDQITAQVAVDLDESILTAICTDTYGNTTTSPVQNGQAAFTGLNPGTQYTVSLKVDGFYKLSGNNTASFTTTRQTNIVSISATTGAEDGSVILSFTVDGTDPENWTVEYAAEGQEPQTMSFAGHMVTINGLTVGSTYSFRLSPTEQTDVAVVGTQTLDFTVSPVILAENITIESFNDGLMQIRWNAPEGTQVDEWTISCTDGGEYNDSRTVTDCAASFSGITVDTTYTLEILAQGMTQSARAEVTPKELTVTGISCTPVNTSTLRITWEYEGDAPAAGWSVNYSMDGQNGPVLTSDTNAVDLFPVIPGAVYTINVAGVETTYEAPAAGSFSAHGISATDLSYSTCIAPSASGWDQNDVQTYTANFNPGQSVGVVVYSKANVRADNEDVEILFLLRREDGTLVETASSVKTLNWAGMWKQNHFCTTFPNVPDDLGLYTLELYFDGALAVSKRIRIE